MKKTWTPGKIIAAVFGSIGACVVLIVSLYASMRPLSASIKLMDKLFYDSQDEHREIAGLDPETPQESTYPEQPDRSRADNETSDEEAEDDDRPDKDSFAGDQYYEFHNEISKDLSYQVSMEEFSEFATTNPKVRTGGNYPKVICEDKKKEERVNNIIYREIESVFDHLEYVGQELDEETLFMFAVESYVTFMDEDTLSVAYVEYGYLDDETFESYVISVNVDMESGLAMTNSQILNINDDFSIDFRERTERQNGSNEMLDYYSDQEITQLLNDEDSLIIFYTPLGMEVGFNFYYGWVTVTYQDYARYVNPL